MGKKICDQDKITFNYECKKCKRKGAEITTFLIMMQLCKLDIPQQVRMDSGGESSVERGFTGILDSETRPCKKHLCPYCEYTTNESTSMKRHIRTHTGEKPFLCPYCPVRTTRKASLLSHMQSHTGEKPYSCNYCSYESRQKSNIARHIKTHHRRSICHSLISDIENI